ncbi:MAG: HIT family protein [Ilumatobacteraceae bacterium]
MLERLWSGWRSTYVVGAPTRSDDDDDGASVFSRLLDSGLTDDETHIVHRSTTCFVVANVYPYTSGHVLVVPYREVADLEDLGDDETADLWATMTATVRTVRAAYRPDGVNVGLNLGRPAGGSVPNHLHVHVVPRWTGDSNFMSAIANTQSLPEALDETARKLREAWPGE